MTRAASPKELRLFLVDDDAQVRSGLRLLLALNRDLTFCGEAEDAPTALDRMLALKPDLAIVDLCLKIGNGFDLVRQLRSQSPELRILVLSMHDDLDSVARALQAGADGYLTKDEAADKIVEAIHAVIARHSYFTAKMALKWGAAATFKSPQRFPPRQS
jgi:DNA-binding NarL/FixJ family response regulator